MALGPWNSPPNFIGAMSAGASAGLQARGQDIAQGEAADRLTLAYNQLASEERQRTEAAKQRMQAAQKMMAYRQQQLSLLDQYRQERITQQTSEAKEKARIAQEAIDLKKQPKLHFGTQGQVLQEMPDGTVKEVRPRDTATTKVNVFDKKQFDDTQKEMANISNQLTSGVLQPSEVRKKRQRLNDLNSFSEWLKVKSAQGAGSATIPTVTSKEQHAALEHGQTYIGSDGKTYRKKGPAQTEGTAPDETDEE